MEKTENDIENLKNVENPIEWWKCEVCGYQFFTEIDLKNHSNVWHKTKRFTMGLWNKPEIFHGRFMEKIHRDIMVKPRGGGLNDQDLR
jgi:hypothetical protein